MRGSQSSIATHSEVVDRMLVLPSDYEARQKTKKRAVQTPDFSLLTSDQLGVVETMQRYAKGEMNCRALVLEGFAGVGKTFTVSAFIEWYITKMGGPVAITAPTNKAVKVLRYAAEYEHQFLEYLTVHKLLGLKEHVDGYGKRSFRPDRSGRTPDIERFKLLIVDETSMLNAELQSMLESYFVSGRLKIIYMGDPLQIPPVGEEQSLPFDDDYCAEMAITRIGLTKVIRQKEGNPIIELASATRRDIHRPVSVYKGETSMTDQGAVAYLDGVRDGGLVNQILQTYFTSEQFKKDADFFKVLAWRNATVNAINDKVRRMIYGSELSGKIMVGEKLIADEPIIEDDSVILFNANDEFEVVSWDIKQEVLNNGDYTLNYYMTRVRQTDNGTSFEKWIKILHEDSQELFDKLLDMIKKVALSYKQGSYPAAEAWKEFFKFKQTFAQVKYNYALTVHKSQGSTYDSCMVMEGDINVSKRVYERNRIKYVGFTRPKNYLFVVKNI